MRARNFIAVLTLVASAVACARSSSAMREPDANRDVITRAQLDQNRFHTAYEAIAALRANWLQVHGTDSFVRPSEIVVYYDDVKLGNIDQLRTIPTETIQYMRHYNGTEATTRWGVGHGAGAILVSSRAEANH